MRRLILQTFFSFFVIGALMGISLLLVAFLLGSEEILQSFLQAGLRDQVLTVILVLVGPGFVVGSFSVYALLESLDV